jgi:hypothetical protein
MRSPRIPFEDPERIIHEALKTLGLSARWLADLMDIPESDLSQRLNIKTLKGCEWYWISNALYISGDSLSFGYFRMHHKANIRWAIRDGYFYLPSTWAFWKLRFEIWRDLIRDVRFQSKYYGFRLRLKARFQDFTKWLERKIKREHREYNPVSQAREHFREGGIGKNYFQPGLKTQLKTEKASTNRLTVT